MRYRLIGSILVCLFSASIFAARFSAGSAILRVNESAMKFALKKEEAVVSLAVENSSASALTARIKLELIDPRGAVRATAMIEASVPSGSSVSTVPMVKIGAGDYDVRGLVWHRLRYEIAAIDSSGKETESVYGLISLSEITPDIFRLLVSAPEEVGKEPKYTIRARALHPLTGKPVPGVNVEAGMAYYLTDLTTGRTEQRRFDLRVTEEQIHIYLIERGRVSEGLPLQFYISTFYADGSPAECEVRVNQTFGAEDDDKSKAGNGNVEQFLTTVKTNRYGVAKVASLDVGKTEENQTKRRRPTKISPPR